MASKVQQLRSEQRAERSRAKVNVKLGRETDPARRLSIAMDYLRSALVANPDHQVAEKTVVDLVKAADRLYRAMEETK